MRLLFIAVLVWAFVRCGIMFRKGARRSSFFLGAALSLPLLSLIFGILIDLGYMKSFFIGGFSFFGLVLFMSVALGLDLRERNKRLSHLAYHDYLTGLPNIARLQEQLYETLADSDIVHMKGALLLVGLDNFKTINDVLGHSIGDQLLKEVGKKMSEIELEDSSAARLGGDEFMLLPKLDVDIQAASVRAHAAAEQILDVLSRPLRKLPVQELKIDKAFVRNLVPGSRDADLAETIISIGRCMGMEVLAEGVETESQRSILTAMNCSTFQGYLLAAPMDEKNFLQWLQNRYRHQEEEYFT